MQVVVESKQLNWHLFSRLREFVPNGLRQNLAVLLILAAWNLLGRLSGLVCFWK